MKFQERNPSNARIKIDYTKGKPMVKFSYPNKHHPFVIIFSTSCVAWTIFTLFICLIFIAIFAVVYIINNPLSLSCTQEITESTITSCGGVGLDLSVVKYFYLFFAWVFMPPLIFTLSVMDNEKFLKAMPKINMMVSMFPFGRYYYTKEITSLNKKRFEIPIFNNTFLDYDAEGEFSKYLIKVQIVEHDLDYVKMSLFNKEKKRTKNEDVWKAIFIFSDIPKTGRLKVKFK